MWVKCKQGLSVVLSIEGSRRITVGGGWGQMVQGRLSGCCGLGEKGSSVVGVGPPQEAHGLSLSSKPSCGYFLDLKKIVRL